MKNPEVKIFEDLDLDKAYVKARDSLAKYEIMPGQFSDLYGAETIRRDSEYVEEMEKYFAAHKVSEQEKIHKIATIFEGIFHEHAEASEWLGPDAMTIKCSRFDDIKNGVDSVAELRESDFSASYLGLAVDVTTSRDLEKKFQKIKGEIERGKLARVKYFISEHTNVRGELSSIPRVVIGADGKTVRELGGLYLGKDNSALAEHPIQFQIIDEIILQLGEFSRYAAKVKQPALVNVFNKTKMLMEAILSKKYFVVKDTGMRDSVFLAIQSQLTVFS